jgi:hypothetical protein
MGARVPLRDSAEPLAVDSHNESSIMSGLDQERRAPGHPFKAY